MGIVIVLLGSVECNPEYTIQGGILQITEQFVGSIAMLECSSSYLLSGNSEYICEENGKWQGSGTCCKLIAQSI